MERPFPAYRGDDSYVFVCYAHKDAALVYSDLVEIERNGIHLWYDEGIPAGTSWRAEIASAIEGSDKLLFFVSASSLESRDCLREVSYAIDGDVEIVPVYLDDSVLPGELQLALSRVQALHRPADSMYLPHLLDALHGRRGIARRGARSGGLRPQILWPLLISGSVVVALLLWMLQSIPLPPGTSAIDSIATPSARSIYLDGLTLIDHWYRDDNLEKAIELFRQASSADPDFALAYARLSEALRMRYALTGDDTSLDEAMENANHALKLHAGLAPVQVALGRVHAARGNIDLAFAATDRALSLDPRDPIANQAMAVVYAMLGRFEDAESSFLKAISLDPDNLLVRDSYANFLYGQSRYSDAVDQWQAVIRLAPDHFAALVNLGTALTEIGRIPEAITMLKSSILVRPTYMAYSNLGTASVRAERLSDAVDAYRKALEIDDSNWLAWGNLAYVYSWMNGLDQTTRETFEQAIQLAESAKDQAPRDAFVHSDLALYYAKTGQPEQADERLQTALVLSPDSGEIQASAAETYEILGQRDRAINSARRALDLGYPWPRLQRNRELSALLAESLIQPM